MSEDPQLSSAQIEGTLEMTRTFSNPICKETYNSLPRIYGKKKKNIRQLKSSTRHGQNQQQANAYLRHYYSANQDNQSTSAVKKKQKRELSVKLSQPKIASQCSKKNCSCKDHHLEQKHKSRKTTARRVLLPQIRKFDLEDLESQHKVSMTGLKSSKASSSSGLQRIIEQQEQMRVTQSNNFAQMHQKTSKSFHRRTQPDDEDSEKKNILRRKRVESMADQKNRHRFKPAFNSKFDIQEEQSQEEMGTDQLKNAHQNKKKKQNIFTGRYKTDVNDSESPKSINSVSLSSFVFKGMKKVNTKFHDLNKTQKSFEQKLSRQASQLSNGLFRIPQEPQYEDYLRHHRPLNENFQLKTLIKQPNFRIIRSDEEVYFGGIDEQQRKHGTGLNVSEKQIFQGNYEKNIKVQGCERNIDGVYEGGFLNGLRSGNGTFKWNNGEVFEGNWENGMKNGMGTWRSPKGDSYVGMWKNNRQEGQGVFKHRMSTYTGEFKNFLKHGYGQEIFANGDIYRGNYSEGKPDGRGRYQWKQGGFYEGDFVKGMRQGRGKWVDADGTIYEGLFKEDFKHGYGKEWYSSGQRYQGQFVEGNKTKGTLYEKNGKIISISN